MAKKKSKNTNNNNKDNNNHDSNSKTNNNEETNTEIEQPSSSHSEPLSSSHEHNSVKTTSSSSSSTSNTLKAKKKKQASSKPSKKQNASSRQPSTTDPSLLKNLPPFFHAFELLTHLEPPNLQHAFQIFIDDTERLVLLGNSSQRKTSHQKFIIIANQPYSIPHPIFVDKHTTSDFTTNNFYRQSRYIYDSLNHELKFSSLKGDSDSKSYIFQLYYNDQFFVILSNIFTYVFDELPKKGYEYGEKVSLLLQVKLFQVLMYIMRYILPQDKNEKASITLRANQFINLVLPYLYRYYSYMANRQEDKILRRKRQDKMLSRRRRYTKEEDEQDPNSYRSDELLDNEAIWEYHLYVLFSTIYHVTFFRPEWVCGSLLRGRASNFNVKVEDVDNRNYKANTEMSSLSFKNIFFGLMRSAVETKHAPLRSRHTLLIVHHLLFRLLKTCHSYLSVKLPIDCKFCFEHAQDMMLLEPLLSALEFTMNKIPKHRSQVIRSEVNQMFKYYVQYHNEHPNESTYYIDALERFIFNFIKNGSSNLASLIPISGDVNSIDPFNLLSQALTSPYQFNTDVIWTCLQTLSIPDQERYGKIVLNILKQHPYMAELYYNTILGNTHDKTANLTAISYRNFMFLKFNSNICVEFLNSITPQITIEHVRQPDKSIPLIVSSILLEQSLLFSKEKLDYMFNEQKEGSMMNLIVIQKILHVFVNVFKKFERMLSQLNDLRKKQWLAVSETDASTLTSELINQYEKDIVMEFRRRFPIPPSLFIKEICVGRIINSTSTHPSPLLMEITIQLFKFYFKYYPDQTGKNNIGVLVPMLSQIVQKYTKGMKTDEYKASENLVQAYIDLLSEMNLSFYHDILPNLVITTKTGNILVDMILGIDYLAIYEGMMGATSYIRKAKLFTDIFSKDEQSRSIVFGSQYDSMHWFMMTFFNDQSSTHLIDMMIKFITENSSSQLPAKTSKKNDDLIKWDAQIFSRFMLYCIENSSNVDYIFRVFVHKFIQSPHAFDQSKRNELLQILKKDSSNAVKSKIMSFTQFETIPSNRSTSLEKSTIIVDEMFYDNIQLVSTQDLESDSIAHQIPYPILFYYHSLHGGSTQKVHNLLKDFLNKFEFDDLNAFEYVNCIKKRWLSGAYSSLYCQLLSYILKRFNSFKDVIFKDSSISHSLKDNLNMISDVVSLWKSSSDGSIIYDEYMNVVNQTLITASTADAAMIDRIILENIEVLDYKKFSQHHLANLLVRNKKNAKFVFSNVEKFGTFVLYLLLGIDNTILTKSTKEKTRLVNIAELVSVMVNNRMVLSTANRMEVDCLKYHQIFLRLNFDEFTSVLSKIVQYISKSFMLIDEHQKQFLTELLCWYCRFSSKYHFVCLRELFRSPPDLMNNPNIILILETIVQYYPAQQKLPENLFKVFESHGLDGFLSSVVNSCTSNPGVITAAKTIIKHFTNNYTYDETHFISFVVKSKLMDFLSLDERRQNNQFHIYYNIVMNNENLDLLQNDAINKQMKIHLENMIENKKKSSKVSEMINAWSKKIVEGNYVSNGALELFDVISTKFASTKTQYFFEMYYLENPSIFYEHITKATQQDTSSLYHIVHLICTLLTKYDANARFISNKPIFEYLLSHYGATLNQTDLVIYLIFNIYETKLSTPLASYHYQFGKRTILRETKKPDDGALTEQEFLSLEWNNFNQQFDKTKLYNTIHHIPDHLTLYGNHTTFEFKNNDQNLICNNDVYDIRYLLRYIMYLMSLFPESSIYRQNSLYLSVAFRCTSSHDYYVRMLAYEIIGMYYNFIVNHVNRYQESDIYEVLVLVFRQIKISLPTPYMRISLPWSMMLSIVVNSILRTTEEPSTSETLKSSEKGLQHDDEDDSTVATHTTLTNHEDASEMKTDNAQTNSSFGDEEEATSLLISVLTSLRDSQHYYMQHLNANTDDLFTTHIQPILTTSFLSLNTTNKVLLREVSRFFEHQRPFLKLDSYPVHRDHVKSINAFGLNYLKVLLFGYQSDEDFMEHYIKNNSIQHLLMSFDHIQSSKSYHVYHQLAILRVLIDVTTRLDQSSEKLIKHFGLLDWIKNQFKRCTNALTTSSTHSNIESSNTEIIRLLMILLCSIYRSRKGKQNDRNVQELLLCEIPIMINIILNDETLLSNMGWKTILCILQYCNDDFKELISLNTINFNSNLIQTIVQCSYLSNSEKMELLLQLYCVCPCRDWNDIANGLTTLILLLNKNSNSQSIYHFIHLLYLITEESLCYSSTIVDIGNSTRTLLKNNVMNVITILYYQYQHFCDLRFFEGLNRIIVSQLVSQQPIQNSKNENILTVALDYNHLLLKMAQTDRECLELYERFMLNSQLSIELREKFFTPLIEDLMPRQALSSQFMEFVNQSSLSTASHASQKNKKKKHH
ncbi:hypothetical protein FDP41_004803 [Naegleria fowleri]|uniref:Nucleolar pre-ribosomal-associated protein 1 C-terminal domain-containing protein n=1 Tax=Naegleria fowleri TaxID=5763 RepID=A0A6A5BPK4_NAEFO|nr:uncharacterized protein FDP41_004803 [Naegleria fowleri]KAF0976128.1 hypothetical protein FDP41_004803 [Naegleria fowleri]